MRAASPLPDLNQHGATLRAVEAELAATRARAAEVAAALAWHAAQDPAALAAQLDALDAEAAAVDAAAAALDARIADARAAADALAGRARPGWNPRAWFSAERRQAKQDHERAAAALQALEADRRTHARKRDELDAQRTARRGELARHRALDVRAAEAERAQLARDADALAQRLRDTRRAFDQVEAAIAGPRADYETLAARRPAVARDLAVAESLEWRLGTAANSYERRMIHDECERRFREGKPARVCGKLRGELARIDRDLEKLHARMQELARRASRDVRALIVDGSNLCYEGDAFVGLAPLQAAVRALAGRHALTVVLDASMCRKLGVDERGLRRALGDDAKVHVTPAHAQADETILALAVDDDVYVVSNDRFVDYRDKPAVRAGRVLRHEIVGGRVLIHDLAVDVPYAAGGGRAVSTRSR